MCAHVTPPCGSWQPITSTGVPKPQHLSVPKAARSEAALLISAMTSDAMHGPPLLLSLSQLIPEALALTVKECISGGSLTGAGATGAGAGAASAAALDTNVAVTAFDGDHETPELMWDATCR